MKPIGHTLYDLFRGEFQFLPEWHRLSSDIQAKWNGLANDTLNIYEPTSDSESEPR